MEPVIQNQQKIFGLVIKLVFQNLENAFCIAQIKLRGQAKEVVVTGILPGIAVGQQVSVTGTWTNHAKFGLQFNATGFDFVLPNEAQAIEKYLSSGLIKGIGPALAARLVQFFGDQTLQVLDSAPHKVLLVPGIGKNKADSIIEAWQAQREISRIMLFLRGHDIPVWLAHKIYARYKTAAVQKITSNPYVLVEEIHGVGFKTADSLALKLGLAPNDAKRLHNAFLALLREAMQNGDLYVKRENLLKKSQELLSLEATDIGLLERELQAMIETEKIMVPAEPFQDLVCLAIAMASEQSIARHLFRLAGGKSSLNIDQQQAFWMLSNKLESLGFAADFSLSEMQVEAVLAALTNKVSIITGGPGTGKTTLLKALCGLLKNQKINFCLAAPTGRAAKRISESTRFHATTLHRLLEYDPSIGKFKRNQEQCIDAQFVIVDEASMVDIFLCLGLLKALQNGTHILFLGDVDQLPSVGPGNILADLIGSEKFKTVRLNNIFRQAADSGIVRAAHAVNQAQLPERGHQSSDFAVVSLPETDALCAALDKIVHEWLPAKKIATQDWIVLSPMHRGAAGCQALNFYLQKLLNPRKPGQQGVTSLGQEFLAGDRVMQLRNNYDKNVFNGDIGHVVAIDAGNNSLAVQFSGKEVLYKHIELDQLVLAYAVSIHKSQGSEFPAVTIPIFTQHFMLLSKKLLYTAITRAKKLCVLVGQIKALAMAVKSQKGMQRVTLLQTFLRDGCTI